VGGNGNPVINALLGPLLITMVLRNRTSGRHGADIVAATVETEE
jgi:hypothetical protein